MPVGVEVVVMAYDSMKSHRHIVSDIDGWLSMEFWLSFDQILCVDKKHVHEWHRFGYLCALSDYIHVQQTARVVQYFDSTPKSPGFVCT
jgi:hypothetical protein